MTSFGQTVSVIISRRWYWRNCSTRRGDKKSF